MSDWQQFRDIVFSERDSFTSVCIHRKSFRSVVHRFRLPLFRKHIDLGKGNQMIPIYVHRELTELTTATQKRSEDDKPSASRHR